MRRAITENLRKGAALTAAAGLLGLAGCDGVLDVDERGIIQPEDIDEAGAAAVPTLINAMVGDYHDALVMDQGGSSGGGIVGYTSMLTDEMILAGTFPTRVEVDERNMRVDNGSIQSDLYVPLHRARLQADTVAFMFDQRVDDPEFEEVTEDLRDGIAMARLYGGYTRLWLGEIFCQSILTGAPGPEVETETEPVLPDDRVEEAIGFLEEAEQRAADQGLSDVLNAALVGQARGHLWLGNHDQAANIASQVPRDFIFWSEYSSSDPVQFNKIYAFTWGDTESIRWTVGDGTEEVRGNEEWEFYDKFVGLNLIEPDAPGLSAFNASIGEVNLQHLYSGAGADIMVASGMEAYLIQAEAAVRNGQTETAEELLNDLRSDYSARAGDQWDVESPAPENELEPLELTGDFEADLKTVVDERARELWLTGDRHVTGRRMRLEEGIDIDIFPDRTADDISFPVTQRELDNNPNIDEACPPGQDRGSRR